ncbi:MAG: imidazole glycerol phosphate synthase subunit HisF, partial [Treponema sp.]|nr:imidazole glycerol phosphate synthase subunit HisF [Treponema sp.]
YEQGVDELVFYDIMASARNERPILKLIEKVASMVFIPFCVGGGISCIDDIRSIINAGAEKVSINSQAVKNPGLITEGARIFGSQCIVLGMDVAKDDTMKNGYRVYINGGRTKTELDALDWSKKAVELGAGEIVLNSIDADGVKTGYELTLTKLISENVSVPVIASGGAGNVCHIADAFTKANAEAALIASMVHTLGFTVRQIKDELKQMGVCVR